MAGETYIQRHGGGFLDGEGLTAADALFLNRVEAALLRLLGEDPAADEVGVWVPGSNRFVFQKITNAQIDAAAAIDKSKLGALNIVNADVASGAAIAKSKLAALNIVNADVDAAAAIAASKLAGYPADATKVLRGDGTWSTPGAMDLLYDNVAGGAIASWDVSSISQAYNHLKIIVQARGDVAAQQGSFRFRLNNDSTAIYDYRYTTSDSGGVSSGEVLAQTSGFWGQHAGGSASANMAGSMEAIIANYASTVFQKEAQFTSGMNYGTASGERRNDWGNARWRNTAAVNRLTLFPGSGNFIAGSRLSIYGIR